MDKTLLDILVCPICKGTLIYHKPEQELILPFQKINKYLPWFEMGHKTHAKIDAQPGLYAIGCMTTGKVYFGETGNLANRYKDTRKVLFNGNYSCKELLQDTEKNGIEFFWFVPLYTGAAWANKTTRKKAEKFLIQQNSGIAYNTQQVTRPKKHL